MSFTPGPSWAQVLDAMVTALLPIAIPDGGAATTDRYVYQLGRYLGQFKVKEGMVQAGIAGRCPAVLVDFAGERPLEASISGRRQRVEGTWLAICCTDKHRTREDRDVLLKLCDDVRRRLVGHRLGLAMSHMTYGGLLTVAEAPELFAYAVKVSATYHVDWSTRPADQVPLAAVTGDLMDQATDPPTPRVGFNFNVPQ